MARAVLRASAKKLFSNPIVHFLAAGMLIYAGSRAFGVDGFARYRLHVSEGHIASMAHAFEQTWSRSPTGSELQTLVDDYVREEILFREAIAAGLLEHDQVVRMRLSQNMEQLVSDLVDAMQPSATELADYLAQHQERFLAEPRVSFDQIYLSRASLELNPDAAEQLLTELRAGSTGAGDASVGDRTSLPPSMEQATLREVSRVFGSDFAAQLAAIEPGGWSEPVISGFGHHLIRLRAVSAQDLPVLESIRHDVEREWRASKKAELDDRYYSELRARYHVSIDNFVEMSGPDH